MPTIVLQIKLRARRGTVEKAVRGGGITLLEYASHNSTLDQLGILDFPVLKQASSRGVDALMSSPS